MEIMKFKKTHESTKKNKKKKKKQEQRRKGDKDKSDG